jgi:hypothetical protein
MATVNNNWPTPVATDLVKDGWEAIKDLGDAIDTTLGVYAPSSSGLELINTTSFSGVSSQSVNDVFSATYDSYKIIVYKDSVSTANNLTLRLRASGTDLTSGVYVTPYIAVKTGDTLTQQFLASSTSFTLEIGSATSSADSMPFVFDLLNPFRTTGNKFMSPWASVGTAGGQLSMFFNAGYVSNNTSYDGFTIIASTGTVTGSVSVYGYNK